MPLEETKLKTGGQSAEKAGWGPLGLWVAKNGDLEGKEGTWLEGKDGCKSVGRKV